VPSSKSNFRHHDPPRNSQLPQLDLPFRWDPRKRQEAQGQRADEPATRCEESSRQSSSRETPGELNAVGLPKTAQQPTTSFPNNCGGLTLVHQTGHATSSCIKPANVGEVRPGSTYWWTGLGTSRCHSDCAGACCSATGQITVAARSGDFSVALRRRG
jgi:hypothetical protein